MASHLSDDDWDRIDRFAKASIYERDPDLLVPDDASTEGEDLERDRSTTRD